MKQLSAAVPHTRGFPGGSEVKASACNVGDPGSIPGFGSSPPEGSGNPFQYSCHGERSLVGYSLQGGKELDTTERLHFHFLSYHILNFDLLFHCSVVSYFCKPMDCSLPSSSVHGISQARILEWFAISLATNCYKNNVSGLFYLIYLSKGLK